MQDPVFLHCQGIICIGFDYLKHIFVEGPEVIINPCSFVKIIELFLKGSGIKNFRHTSLCINLAYYRAKYANQSYFERGGYSWLFHNLDVFNDIFKVEYQRAYVVG